MRRPRRAPPGPPRSARGCAQSAANAAVLLHHDDPRGAAGGSLESERAAAGEEIQANQAVERLSKPVEQRLPHAVRRRPEVGPVRHLDARPRHCPAMMRTRPPLPVRRPAFTGAAPPYLSLTALLEFTHPWYRSPGPRASRLVSRARGTSSTLPSPSFSRGARSTRRCMRSSKPLCCRPTAAYRPPAG